MRIAIGVVAGALDLLMRWVERRLVPWKGACSAGRRARGAGRGAPQMLKHRADFAAHNRLPAEFGPGIERQTNLPKARALDMTIGKACGCAPTR
jgi:hypothetical protein